MALFLMACSQDKTPGSQPAVLKYAARQHRTLFREFFLNGAFCSHDGMILSAKYGFVPMTRTLEDYDLLLDDARAAELMGEIAQQEAVRSALEGHEEVYLYGGSLYRDVMKTVLQAVGFQGSVIEVLGPNRGCCDHFSALQGVFYGMSADA